MVRVVAKHAWGKKQRYNVIYETKKHFLTIAMANQNMKCTLRNDLIFDCIIVFGFDRPRQPHKQLGL